MRKKINTSWNKVSGWYNKLVEKDGHYFHEHIVIPGALKLLKLSENSSVLDLACGQGVFGRAIPANVYYQGIDLSFNLIDHAKRLDRSQYHVYEQGDVTKPLNIKKNDFTDAVIILALQNIENQFKVIKNAKEHLQKNGQLLMVLNHPCFRIPRQSSWGIDEKNKLQYRRINTYLSPLRIPIDMHPGQNNKILTWSFHNPLSFYSQILFANGFLIEKIEEWSSDKKSEGYSAKMENRARSEIPLFLAISARLK